MTGVQLYKLPNHQWAIKTSERECQSFPSIEDACEIMVKLGISNEQIDLALIELAGTGHTRAIFDGNMAFLTTDTERLGSA